MENFPVDLISVRNTEISGNALIQDIKLYLKDADYQEDIDISFQYKDIILSDYTVEREWNLDYTISSKDYDDCELKRTPIELSATDLIGAAYTLESYSVTPGGIKIYGQNESYEKSNEQAGQPDDGKSVIVRITAYDDLGNKYLMYPVYDGEQHYIYTIYDGPADENNEYLDWLDANAKTLTIAFEQLLDVFEDNQFVEEQASLISDELTLNISKEE